MAGFASSDVQVETCDARVALRGQIAGTRLAVRRAEHACLQSIIEVFVWLTYLSTGIRCTIIRVTHVTAGTCGSTGTAGVAARVTPKTNRPVKVEATDARETDVSVVRVACLARQIAPFSCVRR